MIKKIFTKSHVLKAAKIWDLNPGIRGFKTGRLYDVRIKGKLYPPKAIISIANELATGEVLYPSDFKGKKGGVWHQALTSAGMEFKPIEKNKKINKKKLKTSLASEVIDEDELFTEGVEKQKFAWHTKRERDPKVIKNAKELAKQKYGGKLCCVACNFEFKKAYGLKGDGYIEGHHTKPIAQLRKSGEKVSVKDIALVCSNCHRMLHRVRPPITIKQLKNLINK